MPSLFRFYVCSIFFLCPFFSFFSLSSISVLSRDRNDDLSSCSSFSPCLCHFLLLLIPYGFSSFLLSSSLVCLLLIFWFFSTRLGFSASFWLSFCRYPWQTIRCLCLWLSLNQSLAISRPSLGCVSTFSRPPLGHLTVVSSARLVAIPRSHSWPRLGYFSALFQPTLGFSVVSRPA